MNPLLVIVSGPTGIGKTATGIELAQHFQSEIISSDSRQFFRELSIGTAVPSSEELTQIPHHFIHNLSVTDSYNASDFENDVLKLTSQLFKKHNILFLVGGSGLYIDAVCKGIDDLPTISQEVRNKQQHLFESKGIDYLRDRLKEIDPEYYNKVDIHNHKRMLKGIEVYEMTGKPYSSFLSNKNKKRPFKTIKIVLDMNREDLYTRINVRVDKMIEAGLLNEAKAMLPYRNLTPLKTVGYKELFEYFDNKITLAQAIELIKNHSRAYARRQLTWFRRYNDVNWFHPKELDKMIHLINKNLD